MDCFQSQSTVNICIAGLNRRAGYATGDSNFAYWTRVHSMYTPRRSCAKAELVHAALH